jgi:hypothetical protein
MTNITIAMSTAINTYHIVPSPVASLGGETGGTAAG